MGTIVCPRCEKVINIDRALIPSIGEMRAFEIFDSLTRKQREVTFFLLRGLKNREIAIKLSITEQVVKNYLRAIYEKTGTEDRAQLIVMIKDNEYLSKYFKEVKVEDSQVTRGVAEPRPNKLGYD